MSANQGTKKTRKPVAVKTDEQKAKELADKQANARSLATKRVQRTLKAMDLLGNLASYRKLLTDEQMKAIISTFETKAAAVATRLRGEKSTGTDFVLPD